MTADSNRTTFTTSRLLEFFSEKELQMQIGHSRDLWPLALVKELIDNALDACESVDVAPEITVQVDANAVSVSDNGPGLPLSTLKDSLDYTIRVSDKSNYVSPTRGQLGNALKCVWAAPFVIDGSHGCIDVITAQYGYRVNVALDGIAQQPNIELIEIDASVKIGTLVKMYWTSVSRYLSLSGSPDFYRPSIDWLIKEYAAFNPHATFNLNGSVLPASVAQWDKWTANQPTSAHWYTGQRLSTLIAGYLSRERNDVYDTSLITRKSGAIEMKTGPKTVRDFVAQFKGLSGTAKRKQVSEIAGLSGAYLHHMVVDGKVDSAIVERLLAAMQECSNPVDPKSLGIIGEENLSAWMVNHAQTESESISYAKYTGTTNAGLPYVLEIAFGVYTEEFQQSGSQIVIGLNWTPAIKLPLVNLYGMLDVCMVDHYDPVSLVVHLACPQLEFSDRGKSTLSLPREIMDDLDKGLHRVTKSWQRQKRQTRRDERMEGRALNELRKMQRRRISIKQAAWQVMEKAYLKASANGTLPANARQIMYAARPLILQKIDPSRWKQKTPVYFSQHLLPDFVNENPDITASWDVVYDQRGRLTEPHTGREVGIGTVLVRQYIRHWQSGWSPKAGESITRPELPGSIKTHGPTNRYKFALFLEKEGFNELLDAAKIAERYDLAIMSSKGMSTTSTRLLIESLTQKKVTILVLHDFDKAGFSIVHTMQTDGRRYQFKTQPRIVDLGLRLADVNAMSLQSESFTYRDDKDPRENLRESGATEEECEFLVRHKQYKGYSGERVELNAMTSDQFIEWLERKLVEHGVEKVIPGVDTLNAAYMRAAMIAHINKSIVAAFRDFDGNNVDIPDDLDQLVRDALQEDNAIAWDHAIADLAKGEPIED